ncbi:unnamed protein product [Rhizophagus irregularis]|nr:unnamed protein product [Rhizophagus irregularis]CAB5299371.1 unnamed protein product [Rhizophagus irregularis]
MELLSQLYEPDIGTNTNTSEETATATATTNNGPVPSNNGDAATSANDTADESTRSNIKGISYNSYSDLIASRNDGTFSHLLIKQALKHRKNIKNTLAFSRKSLQ